MPPALKRDRPGAPDAAGPAEGGCGGRRWGQPSATELARQWDSTSGPLPGRARRSDEPSVDLTRQASLEHMTGELQPYHGARRSVLAVLVAARRHGFTVTRTKLVKLLYLTDLRHVRRYRVTTTGLAWSWHNFGPFDTGLDVLERDMKSDGSLKSTVYSNLGYYGEYTEIRYETPLSDMQVMSHVDIEFWNIINSVVEQFGSLSSKDLEKLTYKTPPMVEIQEEGKRGDILNLSAKKRTNPRKLPNLKRFKAAAQRQGERHDAEDLSFLVAEVSDWTPLRSRCRRA